MWCYLHNSCFATMLQKSKLTNNDLHRNPKVWLSFAGFASQWQNNFGNRLRSKLVWFDKVISHSQECCFINRVSMTFTHHIERLGYVCFAVIFWIWTANCLLLFELNAIGTEICFVSFAFLFAVLFVISVDTAYCDQLLSLLNSFYHIPCLTCWVLYCLLQIHIDIQCNNSGWSWFMMV